MEIFYCDKCSQQIDVGNVKEGPFVDARGNYYCAACKSRDAVALTDMQTSQSNPDIHISLRPGDTIAKQKSTSTRLTPAQRPRRRSTASTQLSQIRRSKEVWPYALLMGVALLGLVLALHFMSGPAGKKRRDNHSSQSAASIHTSVQPRTGVEDDRDAVGNMQDTVVSDAGTPPPGTMDLDHTPPRAAPGTDNPAKPTRPAQKNPDKNDGQIDPGIFARIPQYAKDLHGEFFQADENTYTVLWKFESPQEALDFLTVSETGVFSVQRGRATITSSANAQSPARTFVKLATGIPGDIQVTYTIHAFKPLRQNPAVATLLFWNGKLAKPGRRSLNIMFQQSGIAISKHTGGHKAEPILNIQKQDLIEEKNLRKSILAGAKIRYENGRLKLYRNAKTTQPYLDKEIPLDLDPEQKYVGIMVANALLSIEHLYVTGQMTPRSQ